jgi:hypothetical protein
MNQEHEHPVVGVKLYKDKVEMTMKTDEETQKLVAAVHQILVIRDIPREEFDNVITTDEKQPRVVYWDQDPYHCFQKIFALPRMLEIEKDTKVMLCVEKTKHKNDYFSGLQDAGLEPQYEGDESNSCVISLSLDSYARYKQFQQCFKNQPSFTELHKNRDNPTTDTLPPEECAVYASVDEMQSFLRKYAAFLMATDSPNSFLKQSLQSVYIETFVAPLTSSLQALKEKLKECEKNSLVTEEDVLHVQMSSFIDELSKLNIAPPDKKNPKVVDVKKPPNHYQTPLYRLQTQTIQKKLHQSRFVKPIENPPALQNNINAVQQQPQPQGDLDENKGWKDIGVGSKSYASASQMYPVPSGLPTEYHTTSGNSMVVDQPKKTEPKRELYEKDKGHEKEKRVGQ